MITATVQIVLDVVRHGYLKLSNFNLIVFDECHNAQGEHPMSHLMAKFADVPESDHPRVIGLSGSLTSSSVKPQNVLKELKDLEAKFRASIVTVQGLNAYEDVLMHSTKPNESVIQFEQYSHTAFINFIMNQAGGLKNMISTWPIINTRNTADETLKRVPTIQKKINSICDDFIYHIGSTGPALFSIPIFICLFDFNVSKQIVHRFIWWAVVNFGNNCGHGVKKARS